MAAGFSHLGKFKEVVNEGKKRADENIHLPQVCVAPIQQA
jgi:hypothetical protein